MRFAVAVLIGWIAVGATAFAQPESRESLDWRPWRYLPVQEGGRYKPLDTLAWETLRTLSNRGRFIDPQSEQDLDPTAVYLAMLFDWQGWDQPVNHHGA